MNPTIALVLSVESSGHNNYSDKTQTQANSSQGDAMIVLIWQSIDLESILGTEKGAWPGVDAISVREQIISPQDKSSGPISISFAYFLQKDLRKIKTEFRVDRAARYMSESVQESTHSTCINIIHSFLVLHTQLKRPSNGCGTKSGVKAIIHNIEESDLNIDPNGDVKTEKELKRTQKPENTENTIPSVLDRQKAMTNMTGLFPDDMRSTEEENETFNSLLEPNVSQLETIGFTPSLWTFVTFSLLTGTARIVSNGTKLQSLSLQGML